MTDGPQYPAYPGDPQEPGRTPPPQQGGYPQQPGPEQPGTYPQGYEPYQPAPAAQGYGHPVHPYASWWSRVGANILDSILSFLVAAVPFIIGLVLFVADTQVQENWDGTTTSTYEGGPLPVVLMLLGGALALGFTIWNMIVRQGRTGQSLGKKVLGIKVVREQDGDVLGVGSAFLRYLMYAIFANVCFLDVLWPLWDARKRTWHDMVVSSVVVRD